MIGQRGEQGQLTPRPVQDTRGVKWNDSLQVATFNCQRAVTALPSSPSNRETVQAVRTPPHRHHLPGFKNSQSESYAEIGADRFRTRLSSVVREFRRRRLGSTGTRDQFYPGAMLDGRLDHLACKKPARGSFEGIVSARFRPVLFGLKDLIRKL